MNREPVRSAGRVVLSHPREQLVDALLENLSRGLASRESRSPQVTLLRRFDDGYEQRIAVWPRVRQRSALEIERRAVFEIPGFGIIRALTPPPTSAKQRQLAEETATWLGAIMRSALPRRRLEKARHDARAARADVEASQIRIARVRESEHIRLVESMTTGALRDLDEVRRMLAEPASDIHWPAISEAMAALIHEFRTVVRGVFPAVLPERGAVEALNEIAATLPMGVEFRGSLGRRARWEIESCFALALASVLGALAVARKPVRVTFSGDGALGARVESTWMNSSMLSHALASDRERLEALGGTLTISDTDSNGLEVAVSVPDHMGVSWLPLSRRQLSTRPVHSRVAALLDSTGLAEHVTAPWRHELLAPVRLLVIQQPLPAPLPGVQVVMCAEHPDGALAERIIDPDGPWGRIDAVVCAQNRTEDFARALEHRPLLFRPGTDPTDAVRMLTARAPVIAARRALAGIADHVRNHPHAESLRWQVERLAASSQELVEDALLDDLARGTAPAVVDDEGARLLGLHGGDIRSRLGLSPDVTSEAVTEVADLHVERWISILAGASLDPASRYAAEVILGSATRLPMT